MMVTNLVPTPNVVNKKLFMLLFVCLLNIEVGKQNVTISVIIQ